MKILFETVNGKEVLKEFENGTLAKTFIMENKDKLSKAQIMEDGYEGAVDKEKNKKFLPSDASTIKNLIMKYAFNFQGNQYVHYEFLANEIEKYILSQTKGQIMESEALDLSDTQKKFVSRFEGNGKLIPYKGKKNRKWKTYESKGIIEKDKEYYIEEDVSGKYEHGAVNVYEPVGKSLRFLFKMSKKHLDEWFIK